MILELTFKVDFYLIFVLSFLLRLLISPLRFLFVLELSFLFLSKLTFACLLFWVSFFAVPSVFVFSLYFKKGTFWVKDAFVQTIFIVLLPLYDFSNLFLVFPPFCFSQTKKYTMNTIFFVKLGFYIAFVRDFWKRFCCIRSHLFPKNYSFFFSHLKLKLVFCSLNRKVFELLRDFSQVPYSTSLKRKMFLQVSKYLCFLDSLKSTNAIKSLHMNLKCLNN